jgi:hypothetical protein
MSDDDDTGGSKKKKLRAFLEAPAPAMKRWHVAAIAVAMFALGAWVF